MSRIKTITLAGLAAAALSIGSIGTTQAAPLPAMGTQAVAGGNAVIDHVRYSGYRGGYGYRHYGYRGGYGYRRGGIGVGGALAAGAALGIIGAAAAASSAPYYGSYPAYGYSYGYPSYGYAQPVYGYGYPAYGGYYGY